MMYRLNLDPEIESRIVAQAAERGVAVEDYLRELIARGTIKENLSESVSRTGLSTWHDDSTGQDENDRLALAGEAIAAQSLPPEDFSDWE